MEEVQSLVKSQLLEEKYCALNEFLRRLKNQAVWERIAKVILYGSVLRGDAGEESDIDVLLVSTGDIQETARSGKRYSPFRCFLISARGSSPWSIAWRIFSLPVPFSQRSARKGRRSTACQKKRSLGGRPKTFWS